MGEATYGAEPQKEYQVHQMTLAFQVVCALLVGVLYYMIAVVITTYDGSPD